MGNILDLLSSKWNSALMKASMVAGLNLNKPTYVCAKMTMRCNSRCAHCNIWQMEYNEQELTTDQWLRTLNELRGWLGKFRMVFTGGEALLRDDMVTILGYAVNLGISVELLSNGLIIDDVLARRIVATGIDQITHSFDGITPDVHDRFRGDAGYHAKTSAAIRALVHARQELNKPLRILLKTVISNNNLHELVTIARWVQAQGLEVQYQPIEQNYGEEADPGWYKQSPLWITDLPALREALNHLRVMCVEGGVIANSADDFDRFYRYFEKPEELMAAIQSHHAQDGAKYCPSAVGNFVISSNGDVQMCFKMGPIGNVSIQSPKEIWRGRARCWAGPCDYR